MTSVLVVDDDVQLRRAVTRELELEGHRVLTADGVNAALDVLSRERVEVLLTDLRMGGRDGIDLLGATQRLSPQTRPILMSAFATSRDHATALGLGAVQVLNKPFTSTELLEAIAKAIECETGFRGQVHGLSLVDMLQMFHYSRRSVTIRVSGAVVGSIHLDQGEIVHAEYGERNGEAALRRILSTPSGAIHTTALKSQVRSIEQSFEALLLDALRLLDEGSGRAGLSIPPPASMVNDDVRGRLRSVLRRHAAEADAWLVERGSGRSEALGTGRPLEGVTDQLQRTLLAADAFDPSWKLFELAHGGITFAVLTVPRSGHVLALGVSLPTKLGVASFRARVRTILAELEAGAEPPR